MTDSDSAATSMDVAASGNVRPAPFRSWAENYQRSDDPIDHQAFAFRRQQRSTTKTAGRRAPVKSIASGSAIFHAQRQLVDAAASQAREADPVLAAQLFLQRRGTPVYRASVARAGAAGWIVGTKGPLSDAELIALANARRPA